DATGNHLLLITCMHLIDERPIPWLLHIEVVPESTVGEWVEHIGESHKKLEMKISQEQRQDVLRPDSLETLFGTVPVLVQLLVPVEDGVEAVGRRQFSPEFMHDI